METKINMSITNRFQLTAIGVFGEHGQNVAKLVVLLIRPVLEYAIILLQHMEENLAMALTKTKILAKRIIVLVRALVSGY